MMSPTLDRRSFLTHSAVTIGGIAMAGSVVDGLLADVAGAAVGVNKGKPKRGGTLTVGTLSDVPNYHIFNGSQGKMDASGFCVANALYDPLFVMSLNGKVALRCWRSRRRPTPTTPSGRCSCARACTSPTATSSTPTSCVAELHGRRRRRHRGPRHPAHHLVGDDGRRVHRRVQHGHPLRGVPGLPRRAADRLHGPPVVVRAPPTRATR